MLVISRKIDEGVRIGGNISITVVEIGKDRVRIGIDAPPEIKIIRNELYDTEKFNVQAAISRVSPETIGKNFSKTIKKPRDESGGANGGE